MPMVYFKPLSRKVKTPPARYRTQLLHKLGKYLIEEIKKQIDRSDMKTKGNIKRSLRYKVGPSSVIISSDHPAFKFLERGIRPHKMIYVRNKLVPIDLADLKNPTWADFRRGVGLRQLGDNPQHPGIDPMNFVKKGLKIARQRLMVDIQNEIWEQAST